MQALCPVKDVVVYPRGINRTLQGRVLTHKADREDQAVPDTDTAAWVHRVAMVAPGRHPDLLEMVWRI